MGIYDTVGDNHLQIKLFKDSSKHYAVGNRINALDGLYITYEGWFVVKDQTILTDGNLILDKYGNIITSQISDIIDSNNPVCKFIHDIDENFKNKEGWLFNFQHFNIDINR